MAKEKKIKVKKKIDKNGQNCYIIFRFRRYRALLLQQIFLQGKH